MSKKYEPIKICPVCGEQLVEIDSVNYFTSICPKCFSTIFEELDGTLHIIKNGISKEDNYNVSLDVFYSQFLIHQMMLNGMFGDVNPGEIIASRIFRVNIYDEFIFNHFFPMIKNFKMKKRPYMYFKGYRKYFEMSDKYTKENFPWFFN